MQFGVRKGGRLVKRLPQRMITLGKGVKTEKLDAGFSMLVSGGSIVITILINPSTFSHFNLCAFVPLCLCALATANSFQDFCDIGHGFAAKSAGQALQVGIDRGGFEILLLFLKPIFLLRVEIERYSPGFRFQNQVGVFTLPRFIGSNRQGLYSSL